MPPTPSKTTFIFPPLCKNSSVLPRKQGNASDRLLLSSGWVPWPAGRGKKWACDRMMVSRAVQQVPGYSFQLPEGVPGQGGEIPRQGCFQANGVVLDDQVAGHCRTGTRHLKLQGVAIPVFFQAPHQLAELLGQLIQPAGNPPPG